MLSHLDLRKRFAPLLATALLLVTVQLWAGTWAPEYEKKVGSEAAAEAEKRYKLVTDEAQVKLVNQIAAVVAKVTDRPDVVYQVKIIDDKEVNAFSLPGGYIYITKGLMTDVQSEHELAGVIAHEIAHNCGFDGLERAKKNERMFMGSLAGALVALLLGGQSDDLNTVLAAGEYVRLGVISQYSMDVEKRADRRAVKYMVESHTYNPVGLLTFMERLAAKERHVPQQELGIYADHPDTNIRSRLIVEYLQAADVDVNRRLVTKWEPPKVVEEEVAGRKVATLQLWGVSLLQTAHAGTNATPQERVQVLADQLKQALEAGLEPYEVTVIAEGLQPQVRLRGRLWLTLYPEDVLPPLTRTEDVARAVGVNLSAAFTKERLERWF